MKVAVAAQGDSLQAAVDQRLGRAPFFIISDPEAESWHAYPNQAVSTPGGAGVALAQYLVDKGVEAVIAGNAGPNAVAVFQATGIAVYSYQDGSVKEALTKLREGSLQGVKEATVASHFGQQKPKTRVETKLIAVATDGNEVAAHFGRCPKYTLVTVTNSEEVGRKVIENPGHEPGFLPGFLADKGVHCIIAGGMGPRAANLFAERGIDSIVGVAGAVDEVVQAYLAGTLVSGESTCNH